MIQTAGSENGWKEKAQMNVHKLGNEAKRRVEMNIMTDHIYVAHVQNLRQTAEFMEKHHLKKWEIHLILRVFWNFTVSEKFQKQSSFKSSLEVSPLVTQLFRLNRRRHRMGDFEAMWSWWWTNYRLRLWIQPPGPSSPPTLRAHPNSSSTSEDDLRRVQIAVGASFWPQCVSLSYCCREKKNLYTHRICLSFTQLWSLNLSCAMLQTAMTVPNSHVHNDACWLPHP